MITTSTPVLDFTEKKQSETENQLPQFAEPSAKTIEAILNFSRNLEVKKSDLIENIELIKS
ncbi:MAG: hypothetical protein K0S32_3293 [Bacteroidetes bacterium]|jgi:hypothetical protein|nr:hypothetical protein [Bacteroidota bacterium]